MGALALSIFCWPSIYCLFKTSPFVFFVTPLREYRSWLPPFPVNPSRGSGRMPWPIGCICIAGPANCGAIGCMAPDTLDSLRGNGGVGKVREPITYLLLGFPPQGLWLGPGSAKQAQRPVCTKQPHSQTCLSSGWILHSQLHCLRGFVRIYATNNCTNFPLVLDSYMSLLGEKEIF